MRCEEVDRPLHHQIQQPAHHQLQEEVQEPYLEHLAQIEATGLRDQDLQVAVAEPTVLQGLPAVVPAMYQDLQVVAEVQEEALVPQVEDADKIYFYESKKSI